MLSLNIQVPLLLYALSTECFKSNNSLKVVAVIAAAALPIKELVVNPHPKQDYVVTVGADSTS